MIKCHKCGEPMIWDSDYDLRDFRDEDGIVAHYHCYNCPISYEIVEVWNNDELIEEWEDEDERII